MKSIQKFYEGKSRKKNEEIHWLRNGTDLTTRKMEQKHKKAIKTCYVTSVSFFDSFFS